METVCTEWSGTVRQITHHNAFIRRWYLFPAHFVTKLIYDLWLFSVMHVITAEHPPSKHNTFAKVYSLSGLREIHMTRERCGSVCISNWGLEVICFGEPACTGLNSTLWTLWKCWNQPTRFLGERKETSLTQRPLRPDSLPLISMQLHLMINLSNEFGVLCPTLHLSPIRPLL